MIRKSCSNFNHGRMNVPIRYCPNCGGTVNEKILPKKCSEDEHATKRRNRSKYCIDCGEQLVK